MFKITNRVRYNEAEKGPYYDKNKREKMASLAPQTATKTPFGFETMSPGDYFYIDFESGREQSMRTMLHQNARIAGIWIKTNVNKRNAKTTTFFVQHDGKRT